MYENKKSATKMFLKNTIIKKEIYCIIHKENSRQKVFVKSLSCMLVTSYWKCFIAVVLSKGGTNMYSFYCSI